MSDELKAQRRHLRKLEIQRAYVARNREKVYAACAEYAATHLKERAEYYRKYRKKKRSG